MRSRLPVRSLFLMAALALLAGGCSDDGGDLILSGGSEVLPEDLGSGDPALLATATFTPAATPVVPTTTVLQDGLNDGLNCVTGQPLTDTPPGADISRAVVEVLPAGSAGEPERVQFTIELDQAPGPDTALFGGVEFADASRAISPLNPQWFYDGIGNQNFSFTIRDLNAVPELHQFDPVSGWAADSNTGFWVEINGNRIFIYVPVSEIPANSPFYLAVTDYSACDAVGLDDNRQPTGQLPGIVDPLATATSLP
jgi:hypothetical protein